MRFDMKEKTNILLGLFVASLILANVLGSKITQFDLPSFISTPLNILFFPIIYALKTFLLTMGGREISLGFFNTISVSVGILTVPLMFLITDIIAEVHGKKKVMEFITTGVIALLLMIVITSIAIAVPASERSIDNNSFSMIFKATIRMTIASILAFVIAQVHDLWAFEFWKRKTEGKHLWLRNNASTVVSQLIDSVVFMFVAFYKTAPMWDAIFVISLIVPFWIFKIFCALLDTPFAYLGVWWLRKDQIQKNVRTRLALS
ncbi:MAG: queuosine precursor transporter [Candidatus Woesearchaeota archaeon]